VALRITVANDEKAVTMKLEGSVAGPAVSEFERTWQSVSASLGEKKLVADLRGVTHMNADGRKILAELYRMGRAQFITDTPMTAYFAEQAQQSN
jgi:anti-anti-sigma regulatory factor